MYFCLSGSTVGTFHKLFNFILSPACGRAPAPPLHNPDEHVTPMLGSTVVPTSSRLKAKLRRRPSRLSTVGPHLPPQSLSCPCLTPHSSTPQLLLLPTLPGRCNPLHLGCAFLSVLMVLPHLIPWLFSLSLTN